MALGIEIDVWQTILASDEDVTATETVPHATMLQCRIGLLLSGESRGLAEALREEAELRGHCVVAAADIAAPELASVDFVLADPFGGRAVADVPTFAVLQQVTTDFLNDEEWQRQLFSYAGYLTISEPVRQFLRGFHGAAGEPCIGRFAYLPKRQFIECHIDQLIAGDALRVCDIAANGTDEPKATAPESDHSYLRRYRLTAAGTAEASDDHLDGLRLLRSPEHLYAGFGAGLVPPVNGAMDVQTLYRLCQIISVGAIAICPDAEWLRRLFNDTLLYYPLTGTAADTVAAIDLLVETTRKDPALAAARAAKARAIFEEQFAADVMLDNAIALFETWRARSTTPADSPARCGILIETDPKALAPVFSRLSDKTIASVARGVAELAPLRPIPSWRFATFSESRDLAAHVRHSLWLAAKERISAPPIAIPWHGNTRLKLHLDNDLSLALFAGGAFEPNEFALLDRLLKPGMVFIDGGANEGVYAVFAGARVGSKGRVIAVEPSPREIERLKQNIALNQLRNVVVLEKALTEHSGSPVRILIAETEHAGQNTLGAFAYEGVEAQGQIEVEQTSLDEIAKEFDLARLDVIKLDIEGGELRALTGAYRVLKKWRPLIILEAFETALAHQGGSCAALFARLNAAGYRLLEFDATTGQPVPFTLREGQASTNIVAVHRERDWGLFTVGAAS